MVTFSVLRDPRNCQFCMHSISRVGFECNCLASISRVGFEAVPRFLSCIELLVFQGGIHDYYDQLVFKKNAFDYLVACFGFGQNT